MYLPEEGLFGFSSSSASDLSANPANIFLSNFSVNSLSLPSYISNSPSSNLQSIPPSETSDGLATFPNSASESSVVPDRNISESFFSNNNATQYDAITGQPDFTVNTDELDLATFPDIQGVIQQAVSDSTSDQSSNGSTTLNFQSYSPYMPGIFTVGDTGEVKIDFLFDGGGYSNGQVAIVSLDGMEGIAPGSRLFNQEAAYRALSDSEHGHIVIDDKTQGARFSGILGSSDQKNFNHGLYTGPKTVKMHPGSLFAIMLVPNGKVQEVFDNPGIGGSKQPLYSIDVANPDGTIHIGQLLDVFGEGTTFGLEDLRTDTGSDMDGNDFIFKLEGAKGYAPLLSDFINPVNDWRYSTLGQEIFAYVSTNDNLDKVVPGDPVRDPILPAPQIPQTPVNQDSNDLSTPAQLVASSTQDVIDQVSSADPTDIYRVPASQLNNAQLTILAGATTVSFLAPSGEVLGAQTLGKGTHLLTLPSSLTGNVLLKIDSHDNLTASYVLQGFESKAPEPFNIDLDFSNGLTASQQSIIRAAAQTIESMIKQGLPSAIVDGKIIDDINIKVGIADLGNAADTLAETKIDFMRYGTLLPALSQVKFNGHNIAELERSGELFSVAQHEFLHALGFGNLWEAKGLVDYAKTPFSRYNGKNAVAAFQAAGGTTNYVPLESSGDGSADLHWDENLFQNEVMTKDLSAPGAAASLSPVTLASLSDLGYEVNLNLATPNWSLIPQSPQGADGGFTEEEKQQLALLIAQAKAQSISDIPTIVPAVDVNTIAPTIWAHAERFDKDGEYYDWERVTIKPGDTISQYVYDRMANHTSSDNRSRVVKANDPAYWAFISTRNGFPNPNWIVSGDSAWLPVWHPNYEQEQEAERQHREAELKQKEEEEKKQRDKLEEAYRQSGQGGLEWYVAKPLPDFSTSAPYETSIRDLVGNLVPDDYFRFTLSRNGRVALYLEDLLADADLYLYDSRNRLIGKSTRSGLTDEKLVLDLAAGTYLVRVNSPSGVTTDYNLKMLFQGQLTRSQMGPPIGWQPGASSTGGSGSPRPTFSDPRIERIFTTARNKFANEQWAQAQPQINNLEAQKQQKQRELDQLLTQAIAEQKAKVYDALNGVRNDLQGRVSGGASGIQNTVNGVANNAINAVNGLVPGWLQERLDQLHLGGLVRSAQDTLRETINSARNWLNSQVDWVRDQINGAIAQFIEMVKNAYMTGAEINAAIEGASNWLKSKTDGLVNFLNDKIGEFKGRILGGLEWTRNIRTPEWARNLGVPDWNLYDHAIVGMVNGVADSSRNAVSGAGSIFKEVLDVATPLAQGAVAVIVDAILGDKTGKLYNEINGINQKIANIRVGVENAIASKTQQIKAAADGLLRNISNTAQQTINTVVNSLEATNLTLQSVSDSIQQGTDQIKISAEQILSGSANIALEIFNETITDLAKQIRPLEWRSEDLGVDTLERFLLRSRNYLKDFKDRWVKNYSNQLIQAAKKNNLAPLLTAGVAWNEVGGQPDYWPDDLTFLLRSLNVMAGLDKLEKTPPGEILRNLVMQIPLVNRLPGRPEETSFGQVQIQIRRAAQELGYDPSNLTEDQQFQILTLLKNPSVDIEVVAKHLASLRKIDFPDSNSQDMNDDEIKIVATRYNRGPDLTLPQVEEDESYGQVILDNRSRILALLT